MMQLLVLMVISLIVTSHSLPTSTVGDKLIQEGRKLKESAMIKLKNEDRRLSLHHCKRLFHTCKTDADCGCSHRLTCAVSYLGQSRCLMKRYHGLEPQLV